MGRMQDEMEDQQNHDEGYPLWYKEQLKRHQPASIQLFGQELEKAASFYSQETNKLHFANHLLKLQLQILIAEVSSLTSLLADSEDPQHSSLDDKRKRVRRCASQIERNYICPVPNCEKSYGTEGSMAQHMRLKHPKVDYVMADLHPEESLSSPTPTPNKPSRGKKKQKQQ